MTSATETYRIAAHWPSPAGVVAFTTTRALRAADIGLSAPPFDRFNLGAACGDSADHVLANRVQLIELARLPSEPCWMRQTHGTDVVRFDAPAVCAPAADAAVSAVPGVVLAILTADCLPVLFTAHDGSEVAAAHAGWRGLSAGVLEATVTAMRTAPSQLQAWLGPAAGPHAYEVGAEVRDAFVSMDPKAALAFERTRPGHWLCDLYRLARQRLASAGVTAIYGGHFCTISAPEQWYSHRRDGCSGRMASVIYRKA
ncbi:MAG: Laccase domain protein YfiH [Alphaproteobacteria bacterium ADurb.BinA280]|nr:peptidoglycan editing factor PgeF [Xanthomonadales bacterium]MCC6506771.1 peptidoglycan editing factor PgeF [Aquimonas sp.]OPZ13762.1 MAG: Laccase domain protein YfiH [Alphaproteobacteria bacterium ADurb.BinA280]